MWPKTRLVEKLMKTYCMFERQISFMTFILYQTLEVKSCCVTRLCTVFRKRVVPQRCLSTAVGEAACCTLFRPSHIVSRSDPAVKTDTYIHMHRLRAGRYLFRLQRHMIVHSSTRTVQERERWENVCEYMCIFSFTALLSDSNRSGS